eukprot:4149705-Pyramimonas_sp.AAC.2
MTSSLCKQGPRRPCRLSVSRICPSWRASRPALGGCSASCGPPWCGSRAPWPPPPSSWKTPRAAGPGWGNKGGGRVSRSAGSRSSQ